MGRVTRQRFDVLVIGGGPAGMAAAIRAAESGQRVGIIDDNVTLGGQIWRGESKAGSEASGWIERLQSSSASVLRGRIFHQSEPSVLLGEADDLVHELSYEKLILATGARERFLPFPGWTLPNVMGAGGLQAMVKCGLPIQGKRVVVAGTGPLLLAVGAYLCQHGAEIPIVCEQASWTSLARFGVALLAQPSKIFQGLQLKKELPGTRFCHNSWPVAASGRAAVESVTISRSGKMETIPCDYLACGFHLVPNLEMPLLLGCQIQTGACVSTIFKEHLFRKFSVQANRRALEALSYRSSKARSRGSLQLDALGTRASCSVDERSCGASPKDSTGLSDCARNSGTFPSPKPSFAAARTFATPICEIT